MPPLRPSAHIHDQLLSVTGRVSKTIVREVESVLPPLTREEIADKAKVLISTRFNTRQQVFISFVLSQYVKVGVEELDRAKLSPLLKLKYNNAVADLGRPEEIGNVSPVSKSISTSKWHDADLTSIYCRLTRGSSKVSRVKTEVFL